MDLLQDFLITPTADLMRLLFLLLHFIAHLGDHVRVRLRRLVTGPQLDAGGTCGIPRFPLPHGVARGVLLWPACARSARHSKPVPLPAEVDNFQPQVFASRGDSSKSIAGACELGIQPRIHAVVANFRIVRLITRHLKPEPRSQCKHNDLIGRSTGIFSSICILATSFWAT